jgi:hypothetical protein
MLWLAFEARQGAEGQDTPRDDVEGVGKATGSVRVLHKTTDDIRIVCGVPVALDTRTRKPGEKQLCAKLPDGRSIAELVRAGIVTLTFI